jgi:long-chain acyl-CoA synthetase
MTSSSAPLSLEKQKEFERIYGIPINQMAGMSEAGWMIGNSPGKRILGSVGTPFKYKTIRIINAENRECGVHEEGEIIVSGKSMGLGYLTDNGKIEEFPDNGFPTGDLGYRDDRGYIFITGRKKDIIIRGGVNISPLEISSKIMEHPLIKEAVTFGIPDKIYGERIASLIVPKSAGAIDEIDIIQYCRQLLPEFKIPNVIKIVDEVPKNERGKIEKEELLKVVLNEIKS